MRDAGRIDNGRRYVLSNNHVLANRNLASTGDVIFQPGPVDGGTLPQHAIGQLARWIRLNLTGGMNTVDTALAEVNTDSVTAAICAIGTP